MGIEESVIAARLQNFYATGQGHEELVSFLDHAEALPFARTVLLQFCAPRAQFAQTDLYALYYAITIVHHVVAQDMLLPSASVSALAQQRFELLRELSAAQRAALVYAGPQVEFVQAARRKLAHTLAKIVQRDIVLRMSADAANSTCPLMATLVQQISSAFQIGFEQLQAQCGDPGSTLFSAVCAIETLGVFVNTVLQEQSDGTSSELLHSHRMCIKTLIQSAEQMHSLALCMQRGADLCSLLRPAYSRSEDWFALSRVVSIQKECIQACQLILRTSANRLPSPHVAVELVQTLRSVASLDLDEKELALSALGALSSMFNDGSASLLQLLRVHGVTFESLLGDSLTHIRQTLSAASSRNRWSDEDYSATLLEYVQSLVGKHIVVLTVPASAGLLNDILGQLLEVTFASKNSPRLLPKLTRFWAEFVKRLAEGDKVTESLNQPKAFLKDGLIQLASHLVGMATFAGNADVLQGLEEWGDDDDDAEDGDGDGNDRRYCITRADASAMDCVRQLHRQFVPELRHEDRSADDEEQHVYSERKEYIFMCMSVIGEVCSLYPQDAAVPVAMLVKDRLLHIDSIEAQDVTTYLRLALSVSSFLMVDSPATRELLQVIVERALDLNSLMSKSKLQVRVLFKTVGALLRLLLCLPENVCQDVVLRLVASLRWCILDSGREDTILPAAKLLAEICSKLRLGLFRDQPPISASEWLHRRASVNDTYIRLETGRYITATAERALLFPSQGVKSSQALPPEEWELRATRFREFLSTILSDFVAQLGALKASEQLSLDTNAMLCVEEGVTLMHTMVLVMYGELNTPRDALWFCCQDLIGALVSDVLPRIVPVRSIESGRMCGLVVSMVSSADQCFRKHMHHVTKRCCTVVMTSLSGILADGSSGALSSSTGTDQVCLAMLEFMREVLSQGSSADVEWLVQGCITLCSRALTSIWLPQISYSVQQPQSLSAQNQHLAEELAVSSCRAIGEILVRHWLYLFSSTHVSVEALQTASSVVDASARVDEFMLLTSGLLYVLEHAQEAPVIRSALQALQEANTTRRLYSRPVFAAQMLRVQFEVRVLMCMTSEMHHALRDDLQMCLFDMVSCDWQEFHATVLGSFFETPAAAFLLPLQRDLLRSVFSNEDSQQGFLQACRIFCNDFAFYRNVVKRASQLA
ncbi:hypothetical protein FVE85_6994 [Porphyridium purpureum]|uniref:Uncharacterized protein n=1 Tax=Porphyridium purpureum TaxID=35688 RepID=A0A5J4Z5S7_PORPP|nr:hypothetical protein FVE85_3871 [Porphyridium purpureum]KAA8499409.1 hypothetical protein FVE85_6994 [Porphyridium purpureum]|eukprot:POR8422..scf229_5